MTSYTKNIILRFVYTGLLILFLIINPFKYGFAAKSNFKFAVFTVDHKTVMLCAKTAAARLLCVKAEASYLTVYKVLVKTYGIVLAQDFADGKKVWIRSQDLERLL